VGLASVDDTGVVEQEVVLRVDRGLQTLSLDSVHQTSRDDLTYPTLIDVARPPNSPWDLQKSGRTDDFALEQQQQLHSKVPGIHRNSLVHAALGTALSPEAARDDGRYTLEDAGR